MKKLSKILMSFLLLLCVSVCLSGCFFDDEIKMPPRDLTLGAIYAYTQNVEGGGVNYIFVIFNRPNIFNFGHASSKEEMQNATEYDLTGAFTKTLGSNDRYIYESIIENIGELEGNSCKYEALVIDENEILLRSYDLENNVFLNEYQMIKI